MGALPFQQELAHGMHTVGMHCLRSGGTWLGATRMAPRQGSLGVADALVVQVAAGRVHGARSVSVQTRHADPSFSIICVGDRRKGMMFLIKQ